MTIKDIYDYIEADWCGDCIRAREKYICPYCWGDFAHYCAVDSVIISLDYIARGEYYG